MKTAYAYLRVSGKGQVEGDGFERQLLAVKRYAAHKGIKIVKVFRDEGVSGTKEWDDRGAFTEMMALLMANGTRTVIVENLSRLARALSVQENIISDFLEKKLEIISTEEPDLCRDDPDRVAFRQIKGVFHQYDRAMLVAKLRGARQRIRAKEGRCEGRKPYGAREGENEVIQRIKHLHKQGLKLQAIADVLNDGDKPTPTRTGARWTPVQINRVLKRKEPMPQHHQQSNKES